MLKIQAQVSVLEHNGRQSNMNKIEFLEISSHYSDADRVILKFGDQQLTFSATELLDAISRSRLK